MFSCFTWCFETAATQKHQNTKTLQYLKNNTIRCAALPYLWVLFAAFLLSADNSGCKGKKSVTSVAKPATEARSVAYLLKKLRENEPTRAQSLSAKADLYLEGDGQSISASANIIWIRDSAVWINVKKFGLEAMRALITRDSFFLLNRLEKTYMARDLGYFLDEYGLPAGFPVLQQTVLGAAWFFPDMLFQSEVRDSLHRLNGSNGRYDADYRLDEGPFLLHQESFTHKQDKQQVNLEFDGFQPWPSGGLFPHIRRIEAFTPKNGWMRMEIKMKDIEVNGAPSFRFEPGGYKKI